MGFRRSCVPERTCDMSQIAKVHELLVVVAGKGEDTLFDTVLMCRSLKKAKAMLKAVLHKAALSAQTEYGQPVVRMQVSVKNIDVTLKGQNGKEVVERFNNDPTLPIMWDHLKNYSSMWVAMRDDLGDKVAEIQVKYYDHALC